MFSKMNWANLLAVNVLPAHLESFQSYLMNMHLNTLNGMRTKGVIFGGRLSVVSGLTVRVSAGIAIMPDGTLIEFPQTDKILTTADPTNPRIDRLELSYTITDGANVSDVNGVTKVLDKNYTPSIDVVVGTPAGSPSAPALNSAKIQIGCVTVPNAAVNLNSGNLSQIPDTQFSISAIQLGDKNAFIRHNQLLNQLQFSYDGNIWQSFGSGGGGGGGANWQPVDGLAPIEGLEYGEKTLQFDQGAGQAVNLMIKVPASYVAGSPIKMRVSHFSPSNANNFKFQTLATLIRNNVDAITTTTNQRTSTNGDVLNTLANKLVQVEYDLTSTSGQINAVNVSAGDLILVRLSRVAPSGAEDTDIVRAIPSSTEVSFS